jgi:ABC-2 type transport system ATP-binding protein
MADIASTGVEQKRRAHGARTEGIVLSARHLTKRYGNLLAVDDLSLEVRRGEIYGFLGPNGAGKTTTIRMCLGLIRPSAGQVEILERDIVREGKQVLPQVGALIEQPALYPYMSGANNLRAVGDALGGVTEERVGAVLDLVGLAGRERDRVKTYSLGMKQRLGLAMALLHDPDLLILDEPTNGLDPAGIVEMRDLLRRLIGEGKTVFLSSHILGEVRQICTRVTIINRGRLIVESSVEELTRGHGEFIVSVSKPEEALALLRQQPWGASARLDEVRRVITGAPEGHSAALNLFLVDAGFTPESIVERAENLEEVFLRLTGAELTSEQAAQGGSR